MNKYAKLAWLSPQPLKIKERKKETIMWNEYIAVPTPVASSLMVPNWPRTCIFNKSTMAATRPSARPMQ